MCVGGPGPGRALAGAGTVVIGHGLTSEMDRPWQVELARQLAAAGFGTLRFSFSGNGGSEGHADALRLAVAADVEPDLASGLLSGDGAIDIDGPLDPFLIDGVNAVALP